MKLAVMLYELGAIKEISKEDFVHIGNHGYSHDYLVDKSDEEIN